MIGFGGNLLSTNLESTYRLKGAQGNANELAAYALCSLALLPAIQNLCRNRWQFLIITLIGIFQIIIVLFTVSKTGFVALAFLAVIWLSFSKNRPAIRRNIIFGTFF